MGVDRIYQALSSLWDCLLTYLIAGFYLPRQMLVQHNAPKDLKSRSGEVAIVTGGNRGIGLQVVKQLLQLQMHVIIACRKPQNEDKNLQQLRQDFPNSTVEVMCLDLSCLSSVRKFSADFIDRRLPLHLLINNSGVMFVPYGQTGDGFEHHFGVNYLGHFLLTHLLLGCLKETGTAEHRSRVVNVSSCVAFVGNINFNDLQNKKGYSPHGCYARSKLAQVMFSWSLQQKLNDEGAFVTVNSLHPGIIYSDLYEHVWWVQAAPFVAKTCYKTPKQGADAIVYCACSQETESESPKYYENCRSVQPPKLVFEEAIKQRLWEESLRLVQLSTSSNSIAS